MSLLGIDVRRGLEFSGGVSGLRLDCVLTFGEKRLQGKFYHGPTVSTKCTYLKSRAD